MFYAYMWLREDGTPYYVGKGFGRRAFRTHWSGTKMRSAPAEDRIILYPAESEADAFEAEIALIWYYGRKDLGTGILRNLTDGGDGPTGQVVSESTRHKMRIARLGKPSNRKNWIPSAEWHRKQSASKMGKRYALGHVVSPETRRVLSEKNLGHTISEETRDRLRASHKGVPWSQARREAYNMGKMSISAKTALAGNVIFGYHVIGKA
jgi:hypothetical protein